MKSGSNVVLETCTNYLSEQDWMFEEVEIRGYGGMCLDLKGGNTAQGTEVQMWRCGALGGKNQKWRVMPNGIIKYGKATSNVCLSSQNGRVFVAPCGLSSVNQSFQLSRGGRIFEGSLQSNKCLDVSAVTYDQYVQGKGSIYNGQSVQTFECLDAQLNQRWSLRGTVKQANTNLCLDRKWGADEAGTGVHLWNCDGNQAQIWEYYFNVTNPDSWYALPTNPFTVFKGEVAIKMDLPSGWSMISLPLTPAVSTLITLFPDAVVVYKHQKGAGYVQVTGSESLEVGVGYWILLNNPQSYMIKGTPITEYTMPVADGWYMSGGCTDPAQSVVTNGSIDVIYEYTQGNGYRRVPKSESLELTFRVTSKKY